MASKSELRARYKRLTDKVAKAYREWHDCTDKGERERLGQVWAEATKKADAFLDRHDF